MTYSVRQYQQNALNDLRHGIAQGVKTQVLMMPTGSGKTVVASVMQQGAQKKGNRSFFVVDTLELIDQTVNRFVKDGLDVGVIQGLHEMTDYSRIIQVASIQTLGRRWAKVAEHLRPKLLVIDECFPENTLVSTKNGYKPIQDIRIGDKVKNANGLGVVNAISKKCTKILLNLELSNGTTIRCTPSHPFFTPSGWKEARELAVGTCLYSEENMYSLWSGILPENMDSKEWGEAGFKGETMEQARVLLDILCQESEKPNEETRNQNESIREAKDYWAQTKNNWWKWKGSDRTSEEATKSTRKRLGSRKNCSCRDGKGEWLSNSLQSRYYQRKNDDSYRSRWELTLCNRTEAARSKERYIPEVIRVESISFEECTSNEVVYNLQVSGHPSYFANGILVHNCHVLHKAHIELIDWCKANNIPVIGLSATPFRKGLGKIFDRLVIGTTPKLLTEQGYLVPALCYAPNIPNLKGIKSKSGDWAEDALAEVMGEAKFMGDIVEHWLQLAEGRKTIVFGCNVAHSREIAKQFNQAGVIAAHIDGYMDTDERADIIDQFRKGYIQVISNVAVLTKGFDVPDVSCVVLARPTKSLMLHIQMIGRGLRLAEGKKDCLIIDHAGNCLRNGLPTDDLPTTLDDGNGKNPDRKVKQQDKQEREPRPCVKCNFVYTGRMCPLCGFKPQAHEDVAFIDGELVPLSEVPRNKRKFTPEEKQAIYAQMLGYAYQHKYSQGWAYYKTKEYCGSMPKNTNVPPIEPTPEIANWIKHKNIRFNKAKAKQQAEAA